MSTSQLQASARRHLWMHFTRMGAYDENRDIPVIERGEGAYVYDTDGKRYLDGLSGLFVVQVGHGRVELAEAGRQAGVEAGLLPAVGLRPHPPASSSRTDSPTSPLATSTVSSSPPVAARRSSRPGSSPASTSSSSASPPATRSSAATSPTTGPRSVRSRSPASRRRASPSSRSCPEPAR